MPAELSRHNYFVFYAIAFMGLQVVETFRFPTGWDTSLLTTILHQLVVDLCLENRYPIHNASVQVVAVAKLQAFQQSQGKVTGNY